MSGETNTPCQVPLIDRLRSVPENAREMIEVSPCHHCNIPYGALCHEAADELMIHRKAVTELQLDRSGVIRDRDNLERELAAAKAECAVLENAVKTMQGSETYIDANRRANAIIGQQADEAKKLQDKIDALRASHASLCAALGNMLDEFGCDTHFPNGENRDNVDMLRAFQAVLDAARKL